MKRVAIIGAGIFGLSVALELTKKNYKVVVFERANKILTGASTINHLRHHFGFHYPRSKETVEEIKSARKSFESEYGECISNFFNDYYGVSLVNSQTTPQNFIKFCNKMDLPYEVAWPDNKYMDRSKIGICIKTPERVYDPSKLKKILLKKIKNKPINLRLNSKIIGGQTKRKIKILRIKSQNTILEESFDFIINATYSNFNSFNKWFGFPRKRLQYEKMELLELEIPNQDKIGLTIMDGEFSSLLPRGEKGTFTLGHVRESVLKAVISDDLDPVVMTSEKTSSNREGIMREGIKDFPFLKDARIVKSLFVTRVVKPDVEATDERPSEITHYGNGIYSIFGGKVITSVDIGRKVARMVIQEDRGKLKKRAIFLDRDGVINKNVKDIIKPDQFELLPDVDKAVKKINDSSYLAIVITNQPVIAKGFCTFKDMEKIHQKMRKELSKSGAKIDSVYLCPHHNSHNYEGEVKKLKKKCKCRKPEPGMLLEAAKKLNIDLNSSWMVGDSSSDIVAGRKAGCKTIFLTLGGGSGAAHEQGIKIRADFVKKDLLEAISFILE